MSEFEDRNGNLLTGSARSRAVRMDGMSRRELRGIESDKALPPGECLQCEDVNDCIHDHDLDACEEMLTGLCAHCHKPITADHHLFCKAGEEGRDGE